jgi:hypothetical protein
MFKRYFIASFVLSFLLGSIALPAQASTSRVVKQSEAASVYAKAVKSTWAFIAKKPFIQTKTEAFNGKVRNVEILKIDSAGNAEESNTYDGSSFYIGDMMYGSTKGTEFQEYEMEIIQRLGLDSSLPYASINAKEIDQEYDISKMVFELRDSLYPETDLVTNHSAKDTKFSIGKTGNTTTLSIARKAINSPIGPIEARVITIKIVNGLITSTVMKYGSKSVSTETLKPFSGIIAAPAGPFLDWNKVYNDPQFNIGNTQLMASYQLQALVKETLAMAAFNDNTEPTLADWAAAIEDFDAVLYDKGIGFTVDDKNKKSFEVCGVFNGNDAVLKMSSCSSLGFTIAQVNP